MGAGRFLFSCCINADAVVIDVVVELVPVEITMFLWSVDVAGAILTPDLPFSKQILFHGFVSISSCLLPARNSSGEWLVFVAGGRWQVDQELSSCL